jgi:hypothetical protein
MMLLQMKIHMMRMTNETQICRIVKAG